MLINNIFLITQYIICNRILLINALLRTITFLVLYFTLLNTIIILFNSRFQRLKIFLIKVLLNTIMIFYISLFLRLKLLFSNLLGLKRLNNFTNDFWIFILYIIINRLKC